MKFINRLKETNYEIRRSIEGKNCKIHLSVSKKNLKMYRSVAGINNEFFQWHEVGRIENFVSLSQGETAKFVDRSRNSPIRHGNYREIVLTKGVRNVETSQFKICFLNSTQEWSFWKQDVLFIKFQPICSAVNSKLVCYLMLIYLYFCHIIFFFLSFRISHCLEVELKIMRQTSIMKDFSTVTEYYQEISFFIQLNEIVI